MTNTAAIAPALLNADLPAVDRPRASAPPASATFATERRRAEALGALGRMPDNKSAAQHQQIAQQMLSQLFFQPLLAEMRRTPFGGSIGHGGRGEEVFGQQLDVHVADAVASRAGAPLARQIVDDLRRMSGRSEAPPGAAG